MRTGPRSIAAHEVYEKEEREAKLFLNYLKTAKVQVPQGRLSDGTGFFVSITESDIIRGLRILHNDGVFCSPDRIISHEPDIENVFKDPKRIINQNMCCIDTTNHAYYFTVRSESHVEVDRYLSGFAEIRRRGKPQRTIDLENLICYCQCPRFSYAYFTLGGRLRICKHVFASMCWLIMHVATRQKQDLPKLKPLIRFVLFSILWVDPKARYDRLREFLIREYKALEEMEQEPVPEEEPRAKEVPKPKEAPKPRPIKLSAAMMKQSLLELYEGATFERLLYHELLDALLGRVDDKHYRSFIGSLNKELLTEKEELKKPLVFRQRKLFLYERSAHLKKLLTSLAQKRMALEDMLRWFSSQYDRTGIGTIENFVNRKKTGLLQQLIRSMKDEKKCFDSGRVNIGVWKRSIETKRAIIRLVVDYYGLYRSMNADAKGVISVINALDLENPAVVKKIILRESKRVGNLSRFIKGL